MEAKELRIGNWVLINDTPNIIRGGGIAAIEAGYFKMPLCPIPLTPEILVKAGFVNGKLNKFHVFGNGNLTVEGYEADYNGLYIGNIKNIYVHQLQNLYFALTGDELNIEL